MKEWATNGNLNVSFLNPGLVVAKGMRDTLLNECFYALRLAGWREPWLAHDFSMFSVFIKKKDFSMFSAF